MLHVGARMLTADGTVAGRIEWREVLRIFRVPHVEDALRREDLRIAGVAGRKDTVEHIYTALHGVQYIYRRADAHQVAWSVCGEQGNRQRDHLVARFHVLADRQTADRIARKVH